MPVPKKVKIFTIEQQFPCGPNASCCSLVGPSEKEVMALKSAIEKLDLVVEVYDIQKIKDPQDHPEVFKMFRSFGSGSAPIITLEEAIVCVGNSDINETLSAIKDKL